jgi:hypothetical protein
MPHKQQPTDELRDEITATMLSTTMEDISIE